MKKTIYIDTYSDLRKSLIEHIETGDYKDLEKRKILAQKFFDAEKVTYNMDEKELHAYLRLCGSPIYDSDDIYTDEQYIDILLRIVKTFNGVLPDQINIPDIKP